MRNDAHDDLQDVPSLSAGRDRPYPQPELQPAGAGSYGRSRHNKRRGIAMGLLWVLVLALIIALGGLAWWSFRQVALLERQLVATQESFARISEDAVVRLQDISGKIVANESSVLTESEALRLRVQQMERQLTELGRQQQLASEQQRSLEDRQAGQEKRSSEQGQGLEQLSGSLQQQQQALIQQAERTEALGDRQTQLTERTEALQGEQARLAERAEALEGELARLQAASEASTGLEQVLEEQRRLGTTLAQLGREVEALQQQGDSSQAIRRIEQDLLILRSELDNRPSGSINMREFDAYRAQVTRQVSTLQRQIANLQAQLDGR